ncbi:MAG: ornithine carbamoyltransferase [Nitrospirae bacterium]|nr:ornithine carbamoyltransferase [Nitrospirota bacterium]
MNDLLTIHDLTTEEIEDILTLSAELKEKQKNRQMDCPLIGRTLGMFFEKPSTRTRVSFEVGVYQLGGQAIALPVSDLQIGRGETIADTAKVLSRYIDAIVIRTFEHKIVEEWAEHSAIPVINGLTDLHHPCQALADVFTIKEKKGNIKGLKLIYIGDGNNVAHSLIEICAKTGIDISLACPKGYEPDKKIVKSAIEDANKHGSKIEILSNPQNAAMDADVLYTDVWASMGQEKEHKKRLKIFKDYQLNKKLLKVAKPDALVMHCLPAHRGEEITEDVLEGTNSVIFDQAENRLHTQKAVMVRLMTAS